MELILIRSKERMQLELFGQFKKTDCEVSGVREHVEFNVYLPVTRSQLREAIVDS
jgi:hypothetical protein